MRLLATIALALTLGACGDPFPQMTRHGGSDAAYSRDDYECRRDAYVAGGMAGGADGVHFRTAISMYRRCMGARGYR